MKTCKQREHKRETQTKMNKQCQTTMMKQNNTNYRM